MMALLLCAGYEEFAGKLVSALREAIETDLSDAEEREVTLADLRPTCWLGVCTSQALCNPLGVVPGEEEGRPSKGSGEDLDPDVAGCARGDDRGIPHRADR